MRFMEVIDYVMDTPQNTNPSVLSTMLHDLVETEIAKSTNPLYKVTVSDDIDADEDLFGKTISDIQSPIQVIEDVIYGQSKEIDYPNFSSKPNEKHGHYIAFHVSQPENITDATIKVNGVTLDSDGIIVLILDRDGMKPKAAKIEITKDGYDKAEIVLDLSRIEFLYN